MTKIRQRQWGRAAHGELDEIVAQLFDDLAAGETFQRNGPSTSMRASPAQRSLHRESDRSTSVRRAEAPPPMHEENAEALTPEEGKFIKDVAAWLAKRPNADLLLDLLAETLWQDADLAAPEAGADEKRADESVTSPTAVEEKPTQEEKPAQEGN